MLQIQSVRLINIGNHSDTTIEFGPLTIIKGWNGEGKSMIADAIEFCLAGKCRGMRLKKDFPNLIKKGESKGTVVLNVLSNNLHIEIIRTLTPSTSEVTYAEDDGGIIAGASAQKLIYRIMSIDESMATVYFDAFALPRLPGKERKKLLQQLVMTGGPEVIAKYLKDKGHEIPEHIMDEITDAFKKDGLGSDTKGAYGVAVTRRRALKRDLEAINNETPPPIADHLKRASSVDMEQSLSRLMLEKAELDNDYDPVAGERKATEDQIRELKLNIEDAEDALNKFVDPDPREALKEAQGIFDRATKALELVADPVHFGIAADLAKAKETLRNHVPGVSVKSIGAIDSALKADQQATIDDTSHKEEKHRAQQAKENARLKLADWQNAARDCEAQQLSLTALGKALENAETKFAGLEQPVERDESEIANRKDMLQKRIDDVNLDMTQVTQYQIYLENQENIKDSRKRKVEGIARWDGIATDLNPKSEGLSELLGGNFGALQEHILSLSTALGVPATLRRDFEIEGVNTVIEYCSVSEQYRIGIAILFALASMLAVGFVSIDSGDILQGEAKNALKRALATISQQGLQVVLYSTGEPTPTEIKPNIRIYSIEKGGVYRDTSAN